jgi:hypothetical protein
MMSRISREGNLLWRIVKDWTGVIFGYFDIRVERYALGVWVLGAGMLGIGGRIAVDWRKVGGVGWGVVFVLVGGVGFVGFDGVRVEGVWLTSLGWTAGEVVGVGGAAGGKESSGGGVTVGSDWGRVGVGSATGGAGFKVSAAALGWAGAACAASAGCGGWLATFGWANGTESTAAGVTVG